MAQGPQHVPPFAGGKGSRYTCAEELQAKAIAEAGRFREAWGGAGLREYQPRDSPWTCFSMSTGGEEKVSEQRSTLHTFGRKPKK